MFLEFDGKTHSDEKNCIHPEVHAKFKVIIFYSLSEIVSEKLESHMQSVVSSYEEFC